MKKIFAALSLVGLMAIGCKDPFQGVPEITGNEAVLRVEDKVKMYVDLNGDKKVDVYCSDKVIPNGLRRVFFRWSNDTCKVSKSYNDSLKGPVIYDAKFHSKKVIVPNEDMVMNLSEEAKVNAEYRALNSMID